MASKIFRDPVHGDMLFGREEVALIDTPQMQRMRGIKQLGTSSLVYPGAVHSRFEHSLGTAWLARKILQAIGQNHLTSGREFPFDSYTEKVVVSAALLHDITHIPYGHTFEDERRIFERHDKNKQRLSYFLDSKPVRTALMSSGIYNDVFDILAGDKEKLPAPFLYQIVAGTICADLLDYLKRDAFFCGVAQSYDERIFRYFSIIDGQFVIELQKRGLFRHDALSELINLLRIRYTLTERVYYHHAKAVAGAMISKALELALENQKIKLEDLFELRDDSFLYFLKTKTHNRAVTRLVTAIENRQLYKRVYLLTLKQNESKTGITEDEQKVLVKKFYYNEDLARTKAEQEIADRLGLAEGSVIIYCPSASMALKEASVPVKIDDQAPRSLKDFQNPEIKTLTDKHRYLWRFFVCLDRKYENKFEQVGQICEEIFGHPNMIKLQSQGQLSFEF